MSHKTNIPIEEASGVIAFWFDELKPAQWFKKDSNLDQLIEARFIHIHEAASQCELWPWRATPLGRLAEVIVLDQFSRNIHRDSSQAFANDTLALALAQEAIATGADKTLSYDQRAFLYMPFMHSESIHIHETALELFATDGLEKYLNFEKRHRDIIRRFGRYPHRNSVLGRESTAQEQDFLAEPGSSF